MSNTQKQGSQEVILAQNEKFVDAVMDKVKGFQDEGQLVLPKHYSPENAMKSALLTLQHTVDKDKHPVLQTCTRRSIANALLDMVLQGLTPAKNQCYFIAYGKELALQRSYFGTQAALKNVRSEVKNVPAQVVYEGDEFEYRIDPATGEKIITKHIQNIMNVDPQKIIAAYASVVTDDGITHTEIMTIAQIHQAWKQSRQNPFDDKGKLKSYTVHAEFADQMAMRTVINRACKHLINTSRDEELMTEAFQRTTEAEYQKDDRQSDPPPTPDADQTTPGTTKAEELKNRLKGSQQTTEDDPYPGEYEVDDEDAGDSSDQDEKTDDSFFFEDREGEA